ncbi:unnamed protein product [Psylliodes chrysocephalus]|uniref:BESS domain-containing protein n=1 Tax=Psylliodes chrysocephalus TaxID=3402493 RepID=A0A9P0CVP9_9CUCU|nr:unnamed protein product [Psylliodes chrysocephala]
MSDDSSEAPVKPSECPTDVWNSLHDIIAETEALDENDQNYNNYVIPIKIPNMQDKENLSEQANKEKLSFASNNANETDILLEIIDVDVEGRPIEREGEVIIQNPNEHENSEVTKSRKRKRNEKMWKQNVRKRGRQSGKENGTSLKGLEQRKKNEDLLGKDEDRHFLLSLLADFNRVPIEKKLDVKLAIIQAIKSAILPTHGAAVPHTPYFSETYPIHPSAFFIPPQPYSNVPQHFNQIPQSPHTFQQNNQILQSQHTQKSYQMPPSPHTSQEINQIPQSPHTSQKINQTPQSPHTSQQINQIPQSPQTSQRNNPIPQSSHTSQQNYQLPQFPSTQHNLQQKILTPLQFPFSVESSDNMSTDGSIVDLLTEY